MKKLIKLSLLVPVPFVLGLILNLVGGSTDNAMLTKVGVGLMAYGTPAIMFILVVVSLIMIITGRWSLNDAKPVSRNEGFPAEEQPAAEESETRNPTELRHGPISDIELGVYQAEQSANIYRMSSRGDKIKGWLFFGFLITDFALCMVFIFLHIMVGFFVCCGIFAGTIILSLIVKVILEKTSMSRRINYDKYDECQGVVKACVISSMTSMGGTRNYSLVSSVNYRVVIIVDGQEYNAYSKRTYAAGDIVTVAVKKNGKGVAKIIESEQDERTEANIFAPAQVERKTAKEAGTARMQKDLAEREALLEARAREYEQWKETNKDK